MERENRMQIRAAYALFAVVVLTASLGNLSQTAVNAMMGGLLGEFGVSVGLGQWLATAYMLVLGITVPVAAFLSQRFSMRIHVLLALSFFLVGSLADLAAPNFTLLLIGRIFQAIATGMLTPLMQTIAITQFPSKRQATAMGIAGVAMGFAPNIGPSIGGAMSFAWGWRSFFVLLTGLTVLLVIAAAALIKPSRAFDKTAHLEVVSLALSTLGFGGLLLGFSNASSFPLSSPFIWVPLATGACFVALFVRRQKRVDNPLIAMDIFASRQYTIGFITQNFLDASFIGITLLVPLYIENLCGGTALEAGIVLLPGTVAALLLNPLAGVLTDLLGARYVTRVAGIFLATGSILMVFLKADTPLWVATACQGIRAMGVSGMIGPIATWSLAKLPKPFVSAGSAFNIVVGQACAALGTSVMVFIISMISATPAGAANPALAYQMAFGFSAAMAVVVLGLIVAKVR